LSHDVIRSNIIDTPLEDNGLNLMISNYF